jgi:pilus assembly protein CpaF
MSRIEQPLALWRRKVHDRLLETIDFRRSDFTRMPAQQIKSETLGMTNEIIAGMADLPTAIDRPTLAQAVLDEAIGLGPLEAMLRDTAISEIMVNRHDEIYVERRGVLEKHADGFTSDVAVLRMIERIVAPLGRRIDESSPMVDARLPDGSRVNAIIPPLALKGPTVTIRKFAQHGLGPAELIALGTLSAPMLKLLEICVLHRRNIVVAGGTGSGKTTTLNLLSGFIPCGERIITIEDAAELRLNHPHLVSLESRPPNAEGSGTVSIRDLLKNALRMRPDRIVIGECRAGEALDMLQAMNTGHEGSLTTLHANSPRDALARLETMVLMAGIELPLQAIREQIASAIDIVVQQTRFASGVRRITSISEVTGIEGGRIQMQEIFQFVRDERRDAAAAGAHAAASCVPEFFDELRGRGVPLDCEILQWSSP